MVTELAEPRRQNLKLGIREVRREVPGSEGPGTDSTSCLWNWEGRTGEAWLSEEVGGT